MKFAYLVLGKFDKDDRAIIHDGLAQIIGVNSIDEAIKEARRLVNEEDIYSIELCGAFQDEGARKIIEAVDNKIPIGYVTYLEEQRDVCRAFFPNDGF